MSDIFAHTISRADFLGSTVRLELAVLVPGDAGTEPKLEPRDVVFIPLDGFLRAMGTMENLTQQLAKAGLIRPANAPAPVAAPVAPGLAN